MKAAGCRPTLGGMHVSQPASRHTSTRSVHQQRRTAAAATSRCRLPIQPHLVPAQAAAAALQQHLLARTVAAPAALAAVILFASQPALAWQLVTPAIAATHAPAMQPSQQQQQQEQQRALNAYADTAEGGLFGLSSIPDKDPIEPFTLYGATTKRFEIEKLQGEKVVKRRRGFTVESCVGGANASAVDSRFESLPAADRVQATGNAQCVRAEGEELKPACALSCQPACKAALETFAAKVAAQTGLQLDPAAGERLIRSCTRSCAYECGKSGQRAHDFSTVYRK